MIEALLLDLDGTLVDTEPAAAQVVRQSFKDWNLGITDEVALLDAQYVTGRTWRTAIEYYASKYKLPLSVDQALDHVLSRYRAGLLTHYRPIPGVQQAISALEADFKLAVISGSNVQDIEAILKHLGIRNKIQFVLGAEDYPQSKPAPDGYQKALSILGLDPKKALVFEDSWAGIESGIAAGAWVAAIEHANHFGQDQSRAHFKIPHWEVVNTEWIRNLKFKP